MVGVQRYQGSMALVASRASPLIQRLCSLERAVGLVEAGLASQGRMSGAHFINIFESMASRPSR